MTHDTYALASAVGATLTHEGNDTWCFLTADYLFCNVLQRDATNRIISVGGKVLGSVRHFFSASDFGAFLLEAQGSRAKVIGLANAGGDTANSIRQAVEFGITTNGQKSAGLLVSRGCPIFEPTPARTPPAPATPTAGPGPSRRLVPPKLRALVDLTRANAGASLIHMP